MIIKIIGIILFLYAVGSIALWVNKFLTMRRWAKDCRDYVSRT